MVAFIVAFIASDLGDFVAISRTERNPHTHTCNEAMHIHHVTHAAEVSATLSGV